MRKGLPYSACVLIVVAMLSSASAAEETATPRPMVETYESLADAILANKMTEWNLVHTILATAYRHAEAMRQRALDAIAAGEDARPALEGLAALVSQIGNEGDASVAAVRKRLVEGGHHHHASGEQQGEYDPGFVVVTRAAKKVFLDSSKAIAKLGASPDAAALEAEWNKVEQQFDKLHAAGR